MDKKMRFHNNNWMCVGAEIYVRVKCDNDESVDLSLDRLFAISVSPSKNV